jgi:hypothetical protein
MKKIILVLIIAVSGNYLKAQDTILDVFQSTDYDFKQIKLRHVKKMQALDIRAMYAKLGYAYELNYSYLITDEAMFHFGGYYEMGKIGYTDFNYKNLKAGISYSVLKIKQNFYVSPDVSLFVGNITGKSNDLDITDTYLNFGGSLGVNVEVYLANKVSMLFVFDEQYNMKDKFGKLHFNTGLGLRFHIK